MTAPNPVIPNTSHFITRRTFDRFFFLRPDPGVNQVLRYLLAYYAKKHNIQLYAYTALSNHHHIVCHDPDGTYPDFCRDFHSIATRAINCFRGRFEPMWSPDRQDPITIWGQESLFDKIVYTVGNSCLSHLVDQIEEWPGVVSAVLDLCGPPQRIERPSFFFSPDGEFPEVVYLEFVKPACFAHWTIDQYRTEISRRLQEKCEAAKEERRRKGIRVVGRLRILAQSPYDRPSTRAPYRGRRPQFACADRNLRMALLEWLQKFRMMHREARLAFEAGDREAVFPFATYLHQKVYGVDCSSLGPPPTRA